MCVATGADIGLHGCVWLRKSGVFSCLSVSRLRKRHGISLPQYDEGYLDVIDTVWTKTRSMLSTMDIPSLLTKRDKESK